jgi:hypothetical protein
MTGSGDGGSAVTRAGSVDRQKANPELGGRAWRS